MAGIIAAVLAAAGAFFYLRNKPVPVLGLADHRSPAAKAAEAERKNADILFANGQLDKAERQYREVVARHGLSRDKDVQDQIGAVGLRLGYIAAKRADFAESKRRFEKTARDFKGNTTMGAAFGGIRDQAAYQAAVSAAATASKQEAKQIFRNFIRNWPLSPLVHAAYKRLIRLGDGQVSVEDDALLQTAVDKQREYIRRETSLCGPKAIAYLLNALNRKVKSVSDIAKACGTTEPGTTIAGMRKGLKSCGLDSQAFVVNRADFAKLSLPAIWLAGDHYVILLSQSTETAQIYDSLVHGVIETKLSPPDDSDFQAYVITLSIPKLEERP